MSTSERFAAIIQSTAPIAAGLLAPALDTNATTAAAGAYLAGAAYVGANYMTRPGSFVDQLPGSDIARAHSVTMGISALTTGMSLSAGILGGTAGTDALMAGFLQPTTVEGIVSLGWWSAVALIPFKLRKVLRRTPKAAPELTQDLATAAVQTNVMGTGDEILRLWGLYISHPENGQCKNQVLTDVTVYRDRWKGRIIAPHGEEVRVKRENVSSVFRQPVARIELEGGSHAGEAFITVFTSPRPTVQDESLEAMWKRRAARRGGPMAGTHLENITKDPNFDGYSCWVVVDEDEDSLPESVNIRDLAGALRTEPLLVSYEPQINPRKAMLRVMNENPLEKGVPFKGRESLLASKGGRFRIGSYVSGHPAMLPMFDPNLGGQHVVIAGTTGSGKGGTAQLVSLGAHVNGAAIMYGDPKGSSNPAIPHMAAHSGTGQDGTLGSLRLHWHVLMWRIQESERIGLKNFKASDDRPWIVGVFDEIGQMVAANMPNKPEATAIVKAGASLGRSMGMPFVLINQVVNLDQLGGEQSIRTNLVNGGSWIMLRSDSDQRHLADLPPGFKAADPGQIPATWQSGEQSLIYDPEADLSDDDPIRTFGLGYLATSGSRPQMMRMDMLEDATEHIDRDDIAQPWDVPWWGDEDYMHHLANTPIPGFEDKSKKTGGSGGDVPVMVPGVDFAKAAPEKEKTAEEKILEVLRADVDPLYLEFLDGNAEGMEVDDFDPPPYIDRAELLEACGVKETTFANKLNALEKAGKLHRIGEGKNRQVGIGPARDDAAEAA